MNTLSWLQAIQYELCCFLSYVRCVDNIRREAINTKLSLNFDLTVEIDRKIVRTGDRHDYTAWTITPPEM